MRQVRTFEFNGGEVTKMLGLYLMEKGMLEEGDFHLELEVKRSGKMVLTVSPSRLSRS